MIYRYAIFIFVTISQWSINYYEKIEFMELYHNSKNIFFTSRIHINETKTGATVEYKILNAIKMDPSILHASSIILHYNSDGDFDGFRFFINDERKKFALIFIDDFETEKNKILSLGDGYSPFYIEREGRCEDELIVKIKKITHDNFWYYVMVSGRSIYLQN